MAVAVRPRGRRTAAARRSPLRPVDLLLAGYLVIVSLVALLRAPRQPGCWWLLAAHALFGVLLYLVTRPGLGPVGRTIREIYPLLLLVGLYCELDVLNGPGATAGLRRRRPAVGAGDLRRPAQHRVVAHDAEPVLVRRCCTPPICPTT